MRTLVKTGRHGVPLAFDEPYYQAGVFRDVLLRRWRVQMVSHVDRSVAQRRAARERLRRALAGDETDDQQAR